MHVDFIIWDVYIDIDVGVVSSIYVYSVLLDLEMKS